MEYSLRNKNWDRDELLACFNLYCRIPFGKFHSRNPEIIDASRNLKRTPAAVAMKLVNFASLDPAHQARNVKGLSNASRLDRALWEEFRSEPNKVAAESEAAFERLLSGRRVMSEEAIDLPEGPTEKIVSGKLRLVQSFFRRAVLASYGHKCSFCRLSIRALLNASHIIPWNVSIPLRADPRNGLCLCVLHDRAFDCGLISVDADHRLLISKQLKITKPTFVHQTAFLDLEGRRMNLPERFLPIPSSLDHHRTIIFKAE